MSLSTDYVWAGGVWASTVWKDCVWMESSCTVTPPAPTTLPGGSSDPARRWDSYLRDKRRKKHHIKTSEEIYRELVMKNLKLEPEQAQQLEVPAELPDLNELERPLDQELAVMIHEAAYRQQQQVQQELLAEAASKAFERVPEIRQEKARLVKLKRRKLYLRRLLALLYSFYL